MSTHNNNYEPTSYVNYERTTPSPYLDNPYLPPPPPEYHMHQRTDKIWKVFVPVVLILFGVSVGILAYPTINGMISPATDTTSKPTPYAPFSMSAVTVAVIPTSDVDQAMNSSNFPTFIQAFNQAMVNKQYDIIKKHTDTKNFQSIILYSDGGIGDWQGTYDRLTVYNLTLTVEYPIVTAKQGGYECVGYSQHGIPGLMNIDAKRVLYAVGTSNDQTPANTAVFVFEVPNGPAVFWLWRGYTLNNVQNCLA